MIKDLKTGDTIEYLEDYTNSAEIAVIKDVLSLQIVLENDKFVFKKNIKRVIKYSYAHTSRTRQSISTSLQASRDDG